MLRQQAQSALAQLREAVLLTLKQDPNGLRVADVASALGIESDVNGKHRNWFARSVLDSLVATGHVVSQKRGAARVYIVSSNTSFRGTLRDEAAQRP